MIAIFVLACASAPPPAPVPAALVLRTRPATAEDDPAAPPEGPSPKVDKRLHVDFATPAEGVAYLDGVVAGLLEGPALDVPLDAVTHACSDDGRRCSFEGPWRDDLQTRWIRAVAEQHTAIEALKGVRITAFRPREVGGGRRFVLESHAP